MKALVIGGGGFVGRYLMKELVSRGHSVSGIDVNASPGVDNVDILDFAGLDRYVARSEPDVIYHLAASAFVHSDEINTFYNINFFGTLNLLRCCNNMEQKPWFVYISSSQVYGSGDSPFTEESPLKAINHYAASKLAAEAIVQAFTHDNRLNTLILRPFNHTGEGQPDIYIIPKLVNAFRDRKPVIHMGNIDVVRDFLDVRDVVSAYAAVLDFPGTVKPGDVFNISSGKEYSIRWILDTLADLTGHSPRIEQKEEFIRSNDITRAVGVNRKFSDTFKWSPQFEFSDTLRWMLGIDGT